MRSIAVLAVLALAGCESRKLPAATKAHAQLVDLTTTLAPMRAAFNAHKGEARFLALLSPT